MRFIALLPLLAAFAAAAQQVPERRVLDAGEGARYAAVGRLNVAGRRFCTATLIEPAVVATAAHCLFHPRTGARVPDSELRFVAGFRRGEYAALRRVVRSVTDAAYVFGAPDFAAVSADLALLALDAPVPDAAAAPFRAGARGDGDLAIVSYARDRPQLPTREGPCPVASDVGGVLALDCGVNFGASGGPVLEGEGAADARLVAVVSAMGRVIANGADVTLAVAIEPALGELRAALDAAPVPVPPPMPRPPRDEAPDNG